MKKILFLAALLTALFAGCATPETNSTTALADAFESNAPTFSADSAYQYIARQVSFGARVPGSAAHRACGDWLIAQLSRSKARVIAQPFTATRFDGVQMPSRNLIASFNPTNPDRIALLAHWDTRFTADQETADSLRTKSVLGADDGASGVGVLLELARLFSIHDIALGVDLIFLDAEDQGSPSGSNEGDASDWCLGAQHWAEHPHENGYRPQYGILLDMVGTSLPQFGKEETSRQYAPKVLDKVWALAAEMGYGNFFRNEPTRGVIDDHLFINQIAGIPTIDIIHRDLANPSGFGGHWHTTHDDLPVISKNSLKMVGQLLVELLVREDNARLH